MEEVFSGEGVLLGYLKNTPPLDRYIIEMVAVDRQPLFAFNTDPASPIEPTMMHRITLQAISIVGPYDVFRYDTYPVPRRAWRIVEGEEHVSRCAQQIAFCEPEDAWSIDFQDADGRYAKAERQARRRVDPRLLVRGTILSFRRVFSELNWN